MIIMSGGQTGADRAGLDFAIEFDIPHSGFCPLGRLAEDGAIDLKYNLTETNTAKYTKRTYCNVFYSDATLIFINGVFTRGSQLTERVCITTGRIYKIIDFSNYCKEFDLNKWIEEHNIKTLNISGSRESLCPGIYKLTKEFLTNNLRRNNG